jgi:hypothetical protein
MKLFRMLPPVCLLTVCLLSSVAGATTREQLGRTEKLRVLVDKVIMAANGWVMTDQHVKWIADAGFNVVSPRLGNEDMAEVRKIATLAGKHGIFHMPWMRGTMIAKGKCRLVWADGKEQELASPNSDELWDWMTGLIVNYARISVDCPALMGVFLDYENYSPGSEGNCYDLSYDSKIMADFAQARGLKLPDLPPAQRAPWLKQHKLDKAFEAFQVGQWRLRCRTLRRKVDAINPKFQFCVYQAPGTKFIIEGIYPEWATKAAPLILADPWIYGRPAGLMPHTEALEANRKILRDNLAFARSKHIPMMYMGGIDPAVRGADPEFSARNAAMSAFETDGYWIFYEGPTFGQPDHEAYWSWFTRANRAIAKGQWRFQSRKRETPDPGDGSVVVRKTDKLQLGVFDTRDLLRKMLTDWGKFEVHELMGLNLAYLKQFDVIVLQNYNVALKTDSPFVQTLRAYVQQGGSVMLAHDTAWFMESPFPEIARRAIPKHSVEAERHVVDTPLQVTIAHQALGDLKPGTQFTPEFRDHMIFKPGPQGVTVISNTFGDPVYVLGQVGKGRVAFVGPYMCYQHVLSGVERQAFLGVVDWLAGAKAR